MRLFLVRLLELCGNLRTWEIFGNPAVIWEVLSLQYLCIKYAVFGVVDYNTPPEQQGHHVSFLNIQEHSHHYS